MQCKTICEQQNLVHRESERAERKKQNHVLIIQDGFTKVKYISKYWQQFIQRQNYANNSIRNGTEENKMLRNKL